MRTARDFFYRIRKIGMRGCSDHSETRGLKGAFCDTQKQSQIPEKSIGEALYFERKFEKAIIMDSP
jgi:hypothetical protein